MESVETLGSVKFGKLSKCEHAGCICTIATGERFCSDYCAEQATGARAATDDDCGCGHPECVHATKAPEARGCFAAE